MSYFDPDNKAFPVFPGYVQHQTAASMLRVQSGDVTEFFAFLRHWNHNCLDHKPPLCSHGYSTFRAIVSRPWTVAGERCSRETSNYFCPLQPLGENTNGCSRETSNYFCPLQAIGENTNSNIHTLSGQRRGTLYVTCNNKDRKRRTSGSEEEKTDDEKALAPPPCVCVFVCAREKFCLDATLKFLILR